MKGRKEEKKSSALRRPALQRLAAFGRIDGAVLVGIVTHETARNGTGGPGGLFGRRHRVIGRGQRGTGDEEQGGSGQREELQHGSISLKLYQEMEILAPFPLPGRLSADIVWPATGIWPCCGFVLRLSTCPMITTSLSSAPARAACVPRASRPAMVRASASARTTGSAAPA